MHYKYTKLIILFILFLVLLFFFFNPNFDIESVFLYFRDESIDPAILLVAILFLPMFFFPITPLLIIVGIRFDTIWAILIVISIIPLHLIFSFVSAKYFFQNILKRYAKNKNFHIFNIPKNKSIEFCFLFMSIPGLPYALKNIVLPVSDVTFRNYFIIGWFIHSLMCIPFIIFGDAASKLNFHFVFISIFLFITIYYGIKHIRNKLNQNIKKL